MASSDSTRQASEASFSEMLLRHRVEIPFFLPLMFAFPIPTTATTTPSNQEGDDSTSSSEPELATRERVILINPLAQTMVVMPGATSDPGTKHGRAPASKESIRALECAVIGEGEGGDQCVVCLEEWGAGDVAKVMPCKHKFHGECIEKWLGHHGSCPVCRYEMPVEEDEVGKKREEERGGRVWVSFSLDFGGRIAGVDVGRESNSSEGGDDSSVASLSGQVTVRL